MSSPAESAGPPAPPRLPIEFYPARAHRAVLLPIPILLMAVPWIAGDTFAVGLSAIWVLLSGIALAFSLVGLVAFRPPLVLDHDGIRYRSRSLPPVRWADIRSIRLLPPAGRHRVPGDILSLIDPPRGVVVLTLVEPARYGLPASPDGSASLAIDCTGIKADPARVAGLISRLSGVAVG